MRISDVAKKGLALVMTMALAVGAVAVAPKEASAAKAAKIPVSLLLCANDGADWISADKDAKTNCMKTVSIKKGKSVSVTLSCKSYGINAKSCNVCCVDTKGILKKFKNVKYSNVSIKCDGKTIKPKYQQGYFEKTQKTDSWRLSIFNQYGNQGDNTKKNGMNKKLKFKKSFSISFTLTAK